ncbi:TonB-dependent receptor domain-containing protein [Zobellella maritima]|uniref:TonB-dependent receptor domain-containing protein n=1 Tax=Zobellella maritima TaxID=2059725 RepID=UPI000E300658|nr:TonB-dependent receptor [Zobellella maritima]
MYKKWLAAGLLPWAAFAQNSSDSTEITVYNRIKQPKATVLAPVEVITKAEIDRRQPKSVVELLSALPGIQFGTQTGGLGHQTSLFTRGTESDHTLVLINGRPVAQSVSGSVDWSQFPVSGIQRVEYIRGPRAAIYGANAIGGVINLITTSDADEVLVSTTAGSNDYYEGNLSVNQWLGEDTHLQLAGGYRETRGYDVRPTEMQPDRDGFEQFNGQLGLTHNIDDNWTADVSLMGWNNKSQFDFTNAFDFGTSANESERQTYQTDGALSYSGEQLYVRFDAGYGETELKTWRDSQGKASAAKIATGIGRLAGMAQYKYSSTGYILAGVDWQQEQLLDGSSLFGASFEAPNRENAGVYTSIFQTWSPLSVELTGRVDDNEQFGTHGTWQSAVSLALPYAHKSTLSYGTAYRAPNFVDLYSPFGGNLALKPEESENWELSVSGDYDVFNWELNLYRNEIDNLIVFDTDTFLPVNSPENTDALIEGAELVVKAATGPVHHRVVLEYTDAKDRNNNDEQLLRRAKRKASWQGEADWLNTSWFVQSLYVGERSDVGNVMLPSYTIWNIGARYPLTQQLTLNGKVNNLFDKDYQVVNGFDAPDMEFYVGADYRF